MKESELKEELIFRDKLALERTYLAKERTILAYVRTGLALMGVALFVYKFVELEAVIKIIAIGVMLVPGAYVTILGIYKTIVYRKERKIFVKSYREHLK